MKQILQSKLWLALLFCAASLSAFSQERTISGTVIDSSNEEPLIGANVVVQGTTTGTVTDLNGNFKLSLPSGSTTLKISFIGFQEQTIDIASGVSDLGKVALKPSAIGLDEIEVIASIAVDRKTPVAVSSIKSEYILEKASNQEFPELLKTTPGVYATKEGGGFGDARINVRGFNDENVAVLINGVPVNDMENGNVYWSNWAGLTDVTRSIQVQRGLGASKVAVPSIGGTINILTKTTDAEKGGYIYYGIGNNNYRKTSLSLSTGLTENNWAVSVSASKIEGDGWADGLKFEAYNYFINVSKMINENHTLSLTGFGAPQWHGQRTTQQTIQTFRDAPQGIKFNEDWGIMNGEVIHAEDNYYHKPQFSLNHYWTINETSELSTALYASVGRGGGGGRNLNSEPRKLGLGGGEEYGPIDFDAIAEENANNPDGSALSHLYNSVNEHEWYGVLSTYNKEVNENFNLLGGLDFRYYIGHHYRTIKNLLGAQYYLKTSDVNDPNSPVGVGDKWSYNNDGKVLWEGVFLQGEYTLGDLDAFISLAGSNTSYQRIDFFEKLDSDPNQKTDYYNFLGYQVKGGANYNLTKNHNIYANVGYFEKAPGFDAVFDGNSNDNINEDAKNQKILSYELGYGFRSTHFSANLNVYRTEWRDRTLGVPYTNQDAELVFLNLTGVNALHQGVELDFTYSPNSAFSFRGMLSMGDWVWNNNVESVNVINEAGDVEEVIDNLYLQDIKVGDAAQTTASFGLDYTVVNNLKIGVSYNYYADNYAYFEPNSRSGEDFIGVQPYEIPDYGLFDVNAVFDFELGSLKGSLYSNVTNLFDEEYVSDATDAQELSNVRVFYGLGRQWTAGLKIKF